MTWGWDKERDREVQTLTPNLNSNSKPPNPHPKSNSKPNPSSIPSPKPLPNSPSAKPKPKPKIKLNPDPNPKHHPHQSAVIKKRGRQVAVLQRGQHSVTGIFQIDPSPFLSLAHLVLSDPSFCRMLMNFRMRWSPNGIWLQLR